MYYASGCRNWGGLLRVDGDSRDLDAPLPWWRLGFDGKAVLEAGFFTYLPAVFLA